MRHLTAIIKDILKGYEGLQGKYIATGRLEDKQDTYAIIPMGRDEAVRRYTDGTALRSMHFKVMAMLSCGLGDEDEHLGLMQGICDYLTEYDDNITFRQVSPPVMEKAGSASGIYSFTMDCIYLKN